MGTTLEIEELNRKIGQLFMAGIPGTQLDGETESLIRDYNPGGVILFSRNIEDPLQLAKLCCDLQAKAMLYHGTHLFLAVDQEGGRVARLKEPFTRFPGNSAMGRDRNPAERAEEFGIITAREMRLVGLNMNLAPVLDVERGEKEKHLIGRTFGDDPEGVSGLGRIVIRSLQENGIMAVAKHFPGLGRANLDPHFHLPIIDSDRREIEEINLPPFRAAIEEGVSAVMTSHAIYTALDPEQPATLSNGILTRLLREGLGYQGLIITDDMEMGAVANHWGIAEGVAASFEAGADILLICENQKNLLEGLALIRGKLLKGEIPVQRFHQSYERIMKTKSRFLRQVEKVSLAKIKEYFKI